MPYQAVIDARDDAYNSLGTLREVLRLRAAREANQTPRSSETAAAIGEQGPSVEEPT